VLFLCGEDAPSRTILSAGAGVFNVTHIQEGPGVFLNDAERTPEGIAAHWAAISAKDALEYVGSAADQTQKFVQIAMSA
jgi:predicted flavoprotein YhiN